MNFWSSKKRHHLFLGGYLLLNFTYGPVSFATQNDGCPRFQFPNGQEGLDYDILQRLASEGNVKIKNNKLSHNAYDSIRYYLVSVSFCQQKTPQGCNEAPTSDPAIVKGRKTLFNNYADLKALNPARAKLSSERPNIGGRAIYDGQLTNPHLKEEKLCFYHYTPVGAPNIDNLKIQFAMTAVPPTTGKQVLDIIKSKFGFHSEKVLEAPEIRGKGKFISTQTLDPQAARLDSNAIRLDQGSCPHQISRNPFTKNKNYLDPAIYKALGKDGKVSLSKDGKMDPKGEVYYLVNALHCDKLNPNTNRCEGNYALYNHQEGKTFLSNHPAQNRLALRGGGMLPLENNDKLSVCIYHQGPGTQLMVSKTPPLDKRQSIQCKKDGKGGWIDSSLKAAGHLVQKAHNLCNWFLGGNNSSTSSGSSEDEEVFYSAESASSSEEGSWEVL